MAFTLASPEGVTCFRFLEEIGVLELGGSGVEILLICLIGDSLQVNCLLLVGRIGIVAGGKVGSTRQGGFCCMHKRPLRGEWSASETLKRRMEPTNHNATLLQTPSCDGPCTLLHTHADPTHSPLQGLTTSYVTYYVHIP